VHLAVQRRCDGEMLSGFLPLACAPVELAEAGWLVGYGTSVPEQGKRAAEFVDQILKGAKPADLPIEQPTKFELVINLKTAKASGLTIPPSLLRRACRALRSRNSFYFNQFSNVAAGAIAYRRHAPATATAPEQFAMVFLNFSDSTQRLTVPF